jgi:hypothetical protein
MTNRFGGRPKLPRQQLRDQRVVTFLTGDERTFLQEFANDANVSVSRACHDLMVMGMNQINSLRLDTKSAKGNK